MALTLFPEHPLSEPKVTFLTGLLATWLAGPGRPTKDEVASARRAAEAAVAELGR